MSQKGVGTAALHSLCKASAEINCGWFPVFRQAGRPTKFTIAPHHPELDRLL